MKLFGYLDDSINMVNKAITPLSDYLNSLPAWEQAIIGILLSLILCWIMYRLIYLMRSGK